MGREECPSVQCYAIHLGCSNTSCVSPPRPCLLRRLPRTGRAGDAPDSRAGKQRPSTRTLFRSATMTTSSSRGLVLHHLEASRSIRVLWLLEYLQVPYELKLYNRDQKTKLAETEPFSGQGLAAIHPIGRSPLLQDDALTLAESGTIFRHLLEHHHGKASCPKPSEKSQAAVDLNFWIDFSEASIMLHLLPLFYLVKGQANTKDGSALQEKVAARGLVNDFKFIETSLEKNGGTLTGGNQLGPADVSWRRERDDCLGPAL